MNGKGNPRTYEIGDTVTLPVAADFNWSQPISIQVVMFAEQKELIEDFHKNGLNPVLAPAWQDGKLIGFGIISAENAVPPKVK